MAKMDTCLALENTVEQLEQAPAIVQETHKLNSLKKELRTMSLLVKELDGQEYEPEVTKWLQQVRDIAYKTQDVIGPIIAEANYQKQRSKLGRLLSGGRTATKNREEEILLQNIEKEIKEIGPYSNTYDINDDEVVGFEDAKDTLVTQLSGNMKSQQLEVVLIYGKAGCGKTTLAKMVWNDDRIMKHFECQKWVFFPQELSLEELLCRILNHNSSSSSETNYLNMDDLKAKVSESLKGKRYLVVIDNMHDSDLMDELKSSFPDELNGSRILLTSPLSPAELHAEQRNSHALKPLNVNQSWQLLSKKVLEGENHPDLENFGKIMAGKCKGLPRDILALAAILDRAEKTKEMWLKFLESWDNLFTYLHLPREEQSCLLYVGLFPIDSHIPPKQMIQMWMAEGFLEQKGSSNRAEDIGEHYLNKLINQAFIQVEPRTDTRAKTCYTSSHVSHFFKSEGEYNNFFKIYKNSDHQKASPRIAIHCDSVTEVLKNIEVCSHVRSLHCYGTDPTTIRSVDLKKTLHNFLHLQVLNLGFHELDKVPKELGKLTYLKYLKLRASNVKYLPSSIVNLQQLETLDMRKSGLVSLPHGIWNMKLLRHLYLGGSTSIPKTQGMNYYRALPNLQTLYGVNTGKVLKRLMVRAKFPNVRKLRISSLDLNLTFNFLQSLDHLYHLQSLRIDKPTTKFPDQNAFPLSLTKLTLSETKLQPEHMKILEKLPNLRILKLIQKAILGEKLVCSAGGFLLLEDLCIENLDVKNLILGEGAMQCVKTFFIRGCNDLEMPDSLRQVATFAGTESNRTYGKKF